MAESSNLMAGKRGLIMGVANDHSIAWGIARTMAAHGAELAFTYQNEAMERRVRPLAHTVDSALLIPCDVSRDSDLDRTFSVLHESWGDLDFVVHAIAYASKDSLKGGYLETSRKDFLQAMEISCYSFTGVAERARHLMGNSGSLLTLTYEGASRVIPNYNVMGVAKAALEASVRYLAMDLGPAGIRVNALSPGPMRTLAGSVISGARDVFRRHQVNAPLRRAVSLDDVGGAALYLLSDLGAAVTGEVHFVDSGYHAIGMAWRAGDG